jgi:hypothetical protein
MGLGSGIRDSGSGKNLFQIPTTARIHNTGKIEYFPTWETMSSRSTSLKILVISLPLFFQRSADWGGMIGRIGAAPTGPSPTDHINICMNVQNLIFHRSADYVGRNRLVRVIGRFCDYDVIARVKLD